MRAVADATPLIALALLGRLDLLRQIFDEVIVPSAVYDEVTSRGFERPGAEELTQADWIRVRSAKAAPSIEPMLLGLDAGEIEVLQLAQEIQPDWVLIDERHARRVARAMGLPIKGTLGILLAAVLAELLSKEEALDALRQLLDKGIRVSARWQAWLREELEK